MTEVNNDALDIALEDAKNSAEQKSKIEEVKELRSSIEQLAEEFHTYGLLVSISPFNSKDIEDGHFGRMHVFVGGKMGEKYHTYESDESLNLCVRKTNGVDISGSRELIAKNIISAKKLTMIEAAQNGVLGIAGDVFDGTGNVLSEKGKQMQEDGTIVL